MLLRLSRLRIQSIFLLTQLSPPAVGLLENYIINSGPFILDLKYQWNREENIRKKNHGEKKMQDGKKKIGTMAKKWYLKKRN